MVIFVENYEQLYYFLFNGITDVVQEMENHCPDELTEQYILMLRLLQANAEERFMQ